MGFRTLAGRVSRLGTEPPRRRAARARRQRRHRCRKRRRTRPTRPRSSRPMSWCRTLAALERWIAARDAQGVVALDTETTVARCRRWPSSSASRWRRRRARPATSRWPSRAADGLELGEPAAPSRSRCDAALARLKPLLEDASVLKIGHNIKYDIAVLASATASRSRRSTTPC